MQKFAKRSGYKLKYVKKHTRKEPDALKSGAQKMLQFLYHVLKSDSIQFFINFDEIPVSLSGKMGKIRTISENDDKDVIVDMGSQRSKTMCYSIGWCGKQ